MPVKELKEAKGYSINSEGFVLNPKGKKIGGLSSSGYVRIVINKKQHYLHRLIGKYFIDNPENKRTINHKDGNKLNNHVDNLEWMTDKENINHAIDNNLIIFSKERQIKKGNTRRKNNICVKIENTKVFEIIQMFKKGFSQCEIAKQFNINQSTVSRYIKGLRREHLFFNTI